jgi:hypothetical protein
MRCADQTGWRPEAPSRWTGGIRKGGYSAIRQNPRIAVVEEEVQTIPDSRVSSPQAP